MSKFRKPIGITLGDPAGIGPEIALKSLLNLSDKADQFHPILFGPKAVVNHPKLTALYQKVQQHFHIEWGLPEEAPFFNQLSFDPVPTAQNGQISYQSLLEAIRWAQAGKVLSILTAPINKTAWHLAQLPSTGHTDILAEQTQSKVSMAFYTPRLKTLLVTVHVPLSKVPALLTRDRLLTAIKNAWQWSKELGLSSPKIALAGLNPHAGEGGLFGNEEAELLEPILIEAEKNSMPIIGPLPPDTLYYRAYHGEFDIVISLYHDQGLIPIKLLAFDQAVNVTVGLPFIRTSPDHGTAYDIAYQDKANPDSMTQALHYLLTYSNDSKSPTP